MVFKSGLIISCKEPAHAKELLEKFGMPFEKENIVMAKKSSIVRDLKRQRMINSLRRQACRVKSNRRF
jgi:phage FluMu gp28-like protein